MQDFDRFENSRMPDDFQESQPRRRAADNPDFSHIPPDLWRLLTDIRDRAIRMEAEMQGVSGAFVKDEDGKPDYRGHREAHRSMIKTAQTLEGIKGDLTKKVLGTLVIIALSLIGSGFVVQLKDLIK